MARVSRWIARASVIALVALLVAAAPELALLLDAAYVDLWLAVLGATFASNLQWAGATFVLFRRKLAFQLGGLRRLLLAHVPRSVWLLFSPW